MTTCDYDVHVEILDDDGATPVWDFNDRVAGYCVESLQMPEESVREIRVEAPRVDGSFLLAWAQGDGVLQAAVHSHGATWGEVASRWEAARAVYRARVRYLVRVTVDGAAVTFRAERPFSVVPADVESSSLTAKRQTYLLRWRVQPDPVVSGEES